MTVMATPVSAARAAFHTLTVASVERLCDDAAAVTFDVPEELRAAYDFEAGQSLTLRRIIDGEDHRRDYSICAAVGERPRVGVRLIPGGLFSQWLVHEVRPGDAVEVQTPDAAASAPTPTPAGGTCASPPGSGITPMISIASSVLRHSGRRGHAALRQPHQPVGDVRRGARRPEEPLRRRASTSCTSCPASRATSSCSPAGSRPIGCAGC